jgi:hypothetical protein
MLAGPVTLRPGPVASTLLRLSRLASNRAALAGARSLPLRGVVDRALAATRRLPVALGRVGQLLDRYLDRHEHLQRLLNAEVGRPRLGPAVRQLRPALAGARLALPTLGGSRPTRRGPAVCALDGGLLLVASTIGPGGLARHDGGHDGASTAPHPRCGPAGPGRPLTINASRTTVGFLGAERMASIR